MSKVRVLIETGEFRELQPGETGKDPYGVIFESQSGSIAKYFVYKQTEIETPKGAHKMSIGFFGQNDTIVPQGYTIIQLPRLKVKKWLWERDHSAYGNLKLATKEPMTEEELKKISGQDYGWRKVEGSEVEE